MNKHEKSMLLLQLGKKVGDLDSSIRDRVSALSVDQLEALGEALLDFSSATDLGVWFAENC